MYIEVYHVPLLFGSSQRLPVDQEGRLTMGVFFDGKQYRQPRIHKACQKHSFELLTVAGYANGLFNTTTGTFVWLKLLCTLRARKYIKYCKECGYTEPADIQSSYDLP